MKISKSWLNDYVDCADLSKEQFYETVTTKVAEVDKVHPHAAAVSGAVVARIKSVRPHPSRDKLVVATVTAGAGDVEVVCGAPNCREGLFTAYVPPGGTVERADGTGALTVEKREVAGVESVGILVSEAELGLTADHKGIIELTGASLAPGAPLAPLVGEPDTILEIDNKSLTHRPDLWCHLGFARELSAILGRPLKQNPDRFADNTPEGQALLAALGSGTPRFKIKIDEATKSFRFTSIGFDGVSCQPSPLWLRRRLAAVGGGVRNLLVDLSNYVMHDIGQPNHAYDADRLQGDLISVRYAKPGEPFLALDGVERLLTKDDVVIADAKGPVSLGGIIGGEASSIQDTTTKLLLESAHFDPVVTRLTAKRQLVRTDASMRFEKSRSAYSMPLALHRFAELLLAIDPRASISSTVSQDFPHRPAPVSVPFRYEYIRDRLDPAVTAEHIHHILTSLGFAITASGEGEAIALVPHERATRDITIEDDLVEEVGRIFGYGNMAEVAPLISSNPQPLRPIAGLEEGARDRLSAQGFSEVSLYSFMHRERAEALGYECGDAVELLNPIDAENNVVRVSLVPGMLGALERNARYQDRAALFELGRAYHERPIPAYSILPNQGQLPNAVASERRLLVLGSFSEMAEERAGGALTPVVRKGAAWYGLAQTVRSLIALRTHASPELVPLELPAQLAQALSSAGARSYADDFSAYKRWMHPRRAAALRVGGVICGVIAEVSPMVDFDLPPRTVVAELDLTLILSLGDQTKFVPLPKFPASFFEMSVVMPEREPYASLETLLKKSIAPEYLRKLKVLDVYQGAPLQPGQKSISVKLFLGHDERTLSSDELAALQTQLVDGVNARFQVRTG